MSPAGAAPPTPPSRTSTLRGSGPPTRPRIFFLWGPCEVSSRLSEAAPTPPPGWAAGTQPRGRTLRSPLPWRERVSVKGTPRPIACRLRGAAPPTPPSRTSTLRGSGPPTRPRISFLWGPCEVSSRLSEAAPAPPPGSPARPPRGRSGPLSPLAGEGWGEGVRRPPDDKPARVRSRRPRSWRQSRGGRGGQSPPQRNGIGRVGGPSRAQRARPGLGFGGRSHPQETRAGLRRAA